MATGCGQKKEEAYQTCLAIAKSDLDRNMGATLSRSLVWREWESSVGWQS